MTEVLFVGMGGFLGSVTRFLLVGLVQGAWSGAFPFGTLVVNVTGCVAIGGLSELLEARPLLTGDARAFLVIGLLGGFTTFSAFGNDTLDLLRHTGVAAAGANVLAHLLLALGGVWLGRTAAQLVT
jgi:CrcB protein